MAGCRKMLYEAGFTALRAATTRLPARSRLRRSDPEAIKRCLTALIRKCFVEFLGTYLLVLLACGVVHSAVMTGSQSGLWQVAAVWGWLRDYRPWAAWPGLDNFIDAHSQDRKGHCRPPRSIASGVGFARGDRIGHRIQLARLSSVPACPCFPFSLAASSSKKPAIAAQGSADMTPIRQLRPCGKALRHRPPRSTTKYFVRPLYLIPGGAGPSSSAS